MPQNDWKLTEFGQRCRELRAKHNKLIRQQAYRFRCEPSDISAIEFGKRDIPEGWALRMGDWLQLPLQESEDLCALADVGRQFELVPKTLVAARLARAVSNRLGTLPADRIQRILQILAGEQGQ